MYNYGEKYASSAITDQFKLSTDCGILCSTSLSHKQYLEHKTNFCSHMHLLVMKSKHTPTSLEQNP